MGAETVELGRSGDRMSTLVRLDNAAREQGGGPRGTLAFGDRLYAAESVWTEPLDDDRWVMFAPDAPGLPVVVPSSTFDLFRSFEGGAEIGVALANVSQTIGLPTIAFLLENGFLGYEPRPPLHSVLDASEVDPPSAVEAWVHLTNGCNLKCAYCFVGDARGRAMTQETARTVAKQLASTAVKHRLHSLTVKFAGGEPTLALTRAQLLRHELESLLVGTETKLSFALISNGTIMNDKVLTFLSRPRTSLTISLDGYGEVHDTFRIYKATGRGSWQTIAANLELLKSHGIRPFIAATISGATCDALPDLLRWVNENGLRTRLNVVRQVDASWERTAATDVNYAHLCDRLSAAFDRAFEVLRDPRYSLEFVSALRLCDLHFDTPVLGACGIGYNHIVIRPDGRIVDCPMTINELGVEGGEDLLQACRDSLSFDTASRSANQQCLPCHWYSVCAGGCPITNQRLNGQAFSRSPFCSFYRRAIPAYIKLLAEKLVQKQSEGATHAHAH